MLEANPELTWLDVQYAFQMSCIITDPSHSSWNYGPGSNFSHEYGFGIPSASRAVIMARRFTKSMEELSCEAVSDTVVSMCFFWFSWTSLTVEFDDRHEVSSTIFISDQFYIHHVECLVNFSCLKRGAMDICFILSDQRPISN